jgi:DNA-binding transcriptional LysR family regulator
MPRMSDPDHLDLDGHLLQLLVAVIDEGSITRAAQRLGVTQSAVSHLLGKLRAIVGDPLFVKSGRGIAPTERAQLLASRARPLLDELRLFATSGGFDPSRVQATVTVAANDLQRDLLLPRWLAALRAQAPELRLRVIPSGVPSAEMLRDEHCDLVISPRPPDRSDILQTRLFEDRYAVFFDPACRSDPPTLAEWLAAEHVTVTYEPRRPLDVDDWLAGHGVKRRIVVQVPGFGGIAPFLRGTSMLATLPSLLGGGQLRGFAQTPVPMACPTMPMYLLWHLRRNDDPMQRWLRQTLQACVAPALAARGIEDDAAAALSPTADAPDTGSGSRPRAA